MALLDDINRLLRDHVGYTGDGQGGNGALPVGDRSTARHIPDSRTWREVLKAIAQAMGDPSALQEILDQVAGKADLANSGKTFATRAAAASAGQAALPASLGQVTTREENYLVLRAPGALEDDPLFETSPRWGVVLRVPNDALLNAKATQTAMETLTGVVGGKADKTALAALAEMVGTKATQTAMETLTGVVGGKADKAALEVGLDRISLAEAERPGEDRSRWSTVSDGAPEARPPLAIGTPVTTDYGAALRISGADVPASLGYVEIAPRRAYAMEPGRTYRLRVGYARAVNPADPAGDSIELRWRNLSATKAHVSNVRLGSLDSAVVADGLREISVLISRAADGVDYTPPATARYGVPILRIYGVGQATDAVYAHWQDVTDAVSGGADVADLRTDVVGLAQNLDTMSADVQGRVPAVDAPAALPVPVAAIGGDAIIVHRSGDGVDFIPSSRLRDAITISLPKVDNPTVIPLAAVGGDAVIMHRGDGVDFLPSKQLLDKLGLGVNRPAEPPAIVPLAAIGGDAVILHRSDGVDFEPSQRLVARLGGAASGTVPAYEGEETLRRMRAKIAALRQGVSGAKLRVLLDGDSWARLEPLRAGITSVLTQDHPLAGEGWLSANPLYASLTGATYTATPGWATIDGTAGGRIYGETPDGQIIHTDQPGEKLTWSNLRCTRFAIYVREHGGSWRYRVDGGAWVTVTDANTAALKRTLISGLPDAPHSFEVESVSGRVAGGGYVMARDGASGIEISRFGDGGATAKVLQEYLPAKADVMAQEPPDLIITVLGTNDARASEAEGSTENYVSYMSSLVAAARTANPDVSVIHIIPPQNALSVQRPTTVYRDAIRAAGLGTAYLSLTEYYDDYPLAAALGLWGDDVHPSAVGGRMIADLLNDNLIRI